MRLDYFVIFPNAHDKLDDVLQILQRYDDVELVYLTEYHPVDMIEFVEDIYASDTVPWEHLKAKTQYIQGLGHKCFIGLMKNHAPEEKLVGEGLYAHIQCMLINRFKWQVREKLNPRYNGERSEEHVIHCSDYESQVYDFWGRRKLRRIEDFLGSPCDTVDLPWHLPSITDYEITHGDVSTLDVWEMQKKGRNKRVPIRDSIYYKYVLGEKEPYTVYWDTFKATRLNEDKSPSAYDKTIDTFDEEKAGYVVVRDGVILDGNHRASILISKGVTSWPILNVLK